MLAVSEQPESDLVSALVRLSFAVHTILGRIGADYHSSIIQIRLLGILRDREPTMAALARVLGLDKSSITGLVGRAERQGLVQRAADPLDGRSVRVTATPQGREVAAAFATEVDRQVGSLVADFTETERAQLLDLAHRIVMKDAAMMGLELLAGWPGPGDGPS
jgi:MarR family transcriptional regulator, lower aerobic nicotinate degradation pathway regulator